MTAYDNGVPLGFDCTKCREHHVFTSYVFAHWEAPLVHNCDSCGARHEIQEGIATPLNDD